MIRINNIGTLRTVFNNECVLFFNIQTIKNLPLRVFRSSAVQAINFRLRNCRRNAIVQGCRT